LKGFWIEKDGGDGEKWNSLISATVKMMGKRPIRVRDAAAFFQLALYLMLSSSQIINFFSFYKKLNKFI